jgi:hypothetical protein
MGRKKNMTMIKKTMGMKMKKMMKVKGMKTILMLDQVQAAVMITAVVATSQKLKK